MSKQNVARIAVNVFTTLTFIMICVKAGNAQQTALSAEQTLNYINQTLAAHPQDEFIKGCSGAQDQISLLPDRRHLRIRHVYISYSGDEKCQKQETILNVVLLRDSTKQKLEDIVARRSADNADNSVILYCQDETPCRTLAAGENESGKYVALFFFGGTNEETDALARALLHLTSLLQAEAKSSLAKDPFAKPQ